ncbi:unnamed protein product [Staurois parvus]|uniref:Uncharacterized protein n=1 Tax=Staurois parvus TaxID=386267 RepID=A0ABN9ES59_9NEOB|nr:unnamed protein product [Staurois parvus]
MKLSKMSWYADALRVPFTGTKSLAIESVDNWCLSAHCALQLSCCRSQLLPLCYNPTNS